MIDLAFKNGNAKLEMSLSEMLSAMRNGKDDWCWLFANCNDEIVIDALETSLSRILEDWENEREYFDNGLITYSCLIEDAYNYLLFAEPSCFPMFD